MARYWRRIGPNDRNPFIPVAIGGATGFVLASVVAQGAGAGSSLATLAAIVAVISFGTGLVCALLGVPWTLAVRRARARPREHDQREHEL
jgi:hypothetical protein